MKLSVTELVNKVFLFCEALAGQKLFDYQAQVAKRIIRSMIENDGATITCLMARQSGKSHTISLVATGCAIILPILANMPAFADDPRLAIYKDKFLCGIFAPALHQSQIIFNKIREHLETESAFEICSDPEINVDMVTNNGENIVLRFNNLGIHSTITCMSASEQSNIEGKSYMMIIVDEAQDVGDFKFSKSIIPMSAFYNGTYVLIGTPTIMRGFFFDFIEENKKDFLSGSRRKSHFEYNWETVARYNPKYLKHIEVQKKRLGESSDSFQMSYNLKWVFERGMFVDPDALSKCAQEGIDRIAFGQTKKYIAGIDLGKSSDSTVVTIGEVDWDNPVIIEHSKDGNVPDYIVYDVSVVDWMEMQGDNWTEQYEVIMQYLSNFDLKRVVVDATGVGSPMFDRLDANLDCTVEPFVFTTRSKSDLFKHFDSQIKAGRFHYPAGEETKQTPEYSHFIEQMVDLEKTYKGQDMVCAAPKKRNAHDDFPCSSALMMWAAKDEVDKPRTEKTNPFVDNSTMNQRVSFALKSRNHYTARRR